MNNLFISCKESRIENNRSFYGCFNLGAFDASQSLTVANALRRTLLSECPGLGIISVTIENVSHEYSTLPGMRESVLDLLLNLKEIIFSTVPFQNSRLKTSVEASISESQSEIEFIDLNPIESMNSKHKKIGIRNTKKPVIGYLKVKGPGIIRAKDLKLPPSIQCVDPDQYIATLAEDGFLCMKFLIMEGKGYMIQKNESLLDYTLVKKRQNFLNELKQFRFTFSSPDNQAKQAKQNPFPSPLSPSKEKAGTLTSISEGSASLPSTGAISLKKVEGLALTRGLGRGKSKPLNLDCIFNPVTKVNYIIEDFDNKITKDFNNNSNFTNQISSLMESSHYLNQNMPLAPNLVDHQKYHDFYSPPSEEAPYGVRNSPPWGYGETGLPVGEGAPQRELKGQKEKKRTKSEILQSGVILNGKAVSNFVDSYTKDELEQISTFLHPLKKPTTLHNIVLEIWTNGSLHPREALLIGFENLGSQFLNLAAHI